jgi:aryl-alcohol dehydrogenase-like predicted oxidoreductase
MRKARLGSRGPEISVIGFGAWEAGGDEWGPNESDETVIRTIREAIDAGIDWIDTAEMYGHRNRSEKLVGRAIEGRRDRVRVATKVAPRPQGTGFSPRQVRKACTASMGRLGTDRIDLYQLHWPSYKVRLEDTWAAMVGLVDEGLVGAIGVSNFGQRRIERCLAIRHVDSLQSQLSLLHPETRSLARWCDQRGIGVLAYGALGYGLLTGAISPHTTFGRDDWRSGKGRTEYWQEYFAPGKIERSLRLADGLRPIARRLGITLGQLALAWTVHQPGVTAAIAGSRRRDHCGRTR